MAIVWMDGFDYYTATGGVAPLSMRYQNTNSATTTTTGRFGGLALRTGLTGGSPSFAIAAASALAHGYALRLDTVSVYATGKSVLQLGTGGTGICNLILKGDGSLQFIRGNTAGTNVLAASAPGLFTDNAWHYVEVEFTRHATAGAVTIYVDGLQVATATGVNTGATDIDTIAYPTSSTNAIRDVDDLYVTNTASKLGEQRIELLVPVTPDTAQIDWTPNSGTTHYSRVNEVPFDGDTTYVSASAASKYDLYNHGALSSTPTSITAVQTVSMARKTDSGLRTIQSKVKSSSTTHDGTERALATGYSIFTDILTTDPSTSAAWDAAGVNASQIGVATVQ